MGLGMGSMLSSEQIWTGLQWWPPDVTSNGKGVSRGMDMSRGGYVQRRGVSLGGTPTMWPISWCLWCYLPPLWTVRLQWKHYLPATTIADGKKLSSFLSETSLSGLYLWEERRPRICKPCHEVFYCNTRCTRLVIYTPRASLCFQLKPKIYGSLSWFSKASTQNNWSLN